MRCKPGLAGVTLDPSTKERPCHQQEGFPFAFSPVFTSPLATTPKREETKQADGTCDEPRKDVNLGSFAVNSGISASGFVINASPRSVVIGGYNYNCASSAGLGAGVGPSAENVIMKVIVNKSGKDDEDEKEKDELDHLRP
ncbi:hypothetical protein AX14_000478 [Amanita brunnescens Koide BX004]|nr:hypothetical protein AX14_000478 [Amanita brunnescens Koide BX004]